jgi:hypothetical protein
MTNTNETAAMLRAAIERAAAAVDRADAAYRRAEEAIERRDTAATRRRLAVALRRCDYAYRVYAMAIDTETDFQEKHAANEGGAA